MNAQALPGDRAGARRAAPRPRRRAQEQGPPAPEGAAPQADELTRQIEELFRTVERNLKQIDVLLNDASAGETPLGAVEDSASTTS
jgi:hypothetical protein